MTLNLKNKDDITSKGTDVPERLPPSRDTKNKLDLLYHVTLRGAALCNFSHEMLPLHKIQLAAKLDDFRSKRVAHEEKISEVGSRVSRE